MSMSKQRLDNLLYVMSTITLSVSLVLSRHSRPCITAILFLLDAEIRNPLFQVDLSCSYRNTDAE